MFACHRAGKAHSALKGDARLLWNHRNGAEAFDDIQISVEDFADYRILAFEMVGKRVASLVRALIIFWLVPI